MDAVEFATWLNSNPEFRRAAERAGYVRGTATHVAEVWVRMQTGGWIATAVSSAAEDTGRAVLAELHAEFAEAHGDDASSNDVVQLLDDFLTKRGFPTVLFGGA